MSRDEARAYFYKSGMTYSEVYEGDILALVMLLNKHLKKSETNLYLSKKIRMVKRWNGTIKYCYLFVNGDYFKERECISFNDGGFIGFAGWASDKNVEPIIQAFLEWCNYLYNSKEK